jgi:hypothetical protein
VTEALLRFNFILIEASAPTVNFPSSSMSPRPPARARARVLVEEIGDRFATVGDFDDGLGLRFI